MRLFICELTILLSLAAVGAGAQTMPPRVEASLSRDTVMIGDLFSLRVEVSKDMVQVVGFPVFDKGTIWDGVEIVKEGPADTVSVKGRDVVLAKEYTLTTFEDGAFKLGKFPLIYADKNVTDTIWSRDSMQIVVKTFEIDTTTQTIYDIKGQLQAPFVAAELVRFLPLAGVLWLLGLIAAIIYVLVSRHRRGKSLFRRQEIPPHLAAIKALEILHSQKVWQNNKHKLYYSSLTDILREYMVRRFGINAMEMTSEEITGAVGKLNISQKSYNELTDLLTTADLVKFAKFIPDPDQNDKVYFEAYYFIEETKPQEEDKKESLPKEEEQA